MIRKESDPISCRKARQFLPEFEPPALRQVVCLDPQLRNEAYPQQWGYYFNKTMTEGDKRTDYFEREKWYILRKEGWTYSEIGRKFERNHATIREWCLKDKIKPVPFFKGRFPKLEVIYEAGIRVNPGKLSYTDYLRVEIEKNKLKKIREKKKSPVRR